MTTQIRSLMFVAAVAILPVACGTSSPMGTDLAALEAGAQVSSFRSDPSVPVPPQAPEPQSPESDTAPAPAPAEPGEIPAEDPKDPQADPGSIELPTSRPAPPSDPNTDPIDPNTEPTDPNTDPLPSPAPPDGNTGSDPVTPNDETQDTVPPTSEPQAIPVPPSSDTVPVCVQDGNPNPACAPAPSPVPPTDPVECQAASIEVMSMRQTILEPAGEGFMAILTDKDGLRIEDGSCEKLVWAVEGDSAGTRAVIHYENDSRYVYIEGMHGTYKVGVTAPNGVAASIGFEAI